MSEKVNEYNDRPIKKILTAETIVKGPIMTSEEYKIFREKVLQLTKEVEDELAKEAEEERLKNNKK